MPFVIPERVGQTYRPSNGTEGMKFEEEFCNQCRHDEEGDEGCSLIAFAVAFQIDEPEYPRDKWIYDENGKPKCTDFEPIE